MGLDENDYIVGVWFAYDKDGNSLFMIIKRGDSQNSWKGSYVFRYKEDNKVFDSKDRKSKYNMVIKDTTEDELINKIHKTFDYMSRFFTENKDFVEVKGNPKKMIELCKDKEWFNFKKVVSGNKSGEGE